jgi:hypothetical protein
VSGIGAALIAHDYVGILREQVGNFCLAFITKLGAYYYYIGQGSDLRKTARLIAARAEKPSPSFLLRSAEGGAGDRRNSLSRALKPCQFVRYGDFINRFHYQPLRMSKEVERLVRSAAGLRVSCNMAGNIDSVISSAFTIFNAQLKDAQPLACRLFETAIAGGKLANAYLLVGRAADDKVSLARQVAGYFNCQSPQRDHKGSCLAGGVEKPCLNCQWIAAGEHPQAWLELSGEGKSGKILVEKARLLTDELGKTSPFVRAVFVAQADESTFHRPAANALLKCIEEPPENVLFFFCAGSAEDVLPTIVSRCQVVPLSTPLLLSHWPGGAAAIGAGMPADLSARIEAARAAFIMQCRQQFNAHTPSHSPVRAAEDGLGLSRQLQELCKELADSIDEHAAAEQALDALAAAQLEVLREQARSNQRCARYLEKLFDLVENTKSQINQYVKQSNALEAFCLAFAQLRQDYSGEISLGKR